jgi:transcriptional regulator with XRE-family HTH domain
VFSKQIGAMLRDARLQVGLTQSELADRTRVSKRLVAELERGQRPNASLETVLQLLHELGVSMRLTQPSGSVTELPGRDSVALARQARARHRRETWTGAHVSLAGSGSPPSGGHSMADRLAAVSSVSRQAHLVARAGKGIPRTVVKRSANSSRSTVTGRRSVSDPRK